MRRSSTQSLQTTDKEEQIVRRSTLRRSSYNIKPRSSRLSLNSEHRSGSKEQSERATEERRSVSVATAKLKEALSAGQDEPESEDAGTSSSPTTKKDKKKGAESRNLALIRTVYQGTKNDLEKIKAESADGISNLSFRRLSDVVKKQAHRTSLTNAVLNMLIDSAAVKTQMKDIFQKFGSMKQYDPGAEDIRWLKIQTAIGKAHQELLSKYEEAGVSRQGDNDKELDLVEQLTELTNQIITNLPTFVKKIESEVDLQDALDACKNVEQTVVGFRQDFPWLAFEELEVFEDLRLLKRKIKTEILRELIFATDWSILTGDGIDRHAGRQIMKVWLEAERERFAHMRDVMIEPLTETEWWRHVNLIELQGLVDKASPMLLSMFVARRQEQNIPTPEEETELMKLEDRDVASSPAPDDETELMKLENTDIVSRKDQAATDSLETKMCSQSAEAEVAEANEVQLQSPRPTEEAPEEADPSSPPAESAPKGRLRRTLIVDTNVKNVDDEDELFIFYESCHTHDDSVYHTSLSTEFEACSPRDQKSMIPSSRHDRSHAGKASRRKRLDVNTLTAELVQKIEGAKQAWVELHSPLENRKLASWSPGSHPGSPTRELVKPSSVERQISIPRKNCDHVSTVWHRPGRARSKQRYAPSDPRTLSARARIAYNRIKK